MAANRFTSVGWPIVPNHYQRSRMVFSSCCKKAVEVSAVLFPAISITLESLSAPSLEAHVLSSERVGRIRPGSPKGPPNDRGHR